MSDATKERELLRWIGRTLGIGMCVVLLWLVLPHGKPEDLFVFALGIGFTAPISWVLPDLLLTIGADDE